MNNNVTETFALDSGSVLGNRYRIEQTIGFGGFSILYKAFDERLHFHVAIKEFYPNSIACRIPHHPEVITRNSEDSKQFQKGLKSFREEAKKLIELKGLHNTVDVFSLIEENKTCYIVMEFLKGQTLLQYLRSLPYERFSDIEDAKQIVYSVADALEYIHSKKILHRDISPDNIFLCSDGKVKLIDFGAARVFAEKTDLSVIVKSGYTPPEQYRKNGRQGPWTDIYALGATFYRMLTGVYPDAAPDRIDGVDEYSAPSAINPQVPEYIDALILRCLAYDYTLRLSNASEIKHILAKELIVSPIKTVRKHRNTIRSAIYLLLFSSLLVFVLIVFVQTKNAQTLYNININPCSIVVEIPDNFTSSQGLQDIKDDFHSLYPQIDVSFVIYNVSTTRIPDIYYYDKGNEPYADLTRIKKLYPNAENQYVTVAYDADILYWNTIKGHENGFHPNDIQSASDIPQQNITTDYTQFYISRNIHCAYLASVSDYKIIQKNLLGAYKCIDSGKPLNPIRLSVRSGLSENQETAAMRFLLYLTSDRAQEILFINNEGLIPVAPDLYNRFFVLNSELIFLKGKEYIQ